MGGWYERERCWRGSEIDEEMEEGVVIWGGVVGEVW